MLANNLSAEDEDAVQKELEQLRREAVRSSPLFLRSNIKRCYLTAWGSRTGASKADTSALCTYYGTSLLCPGG